MQRSRVKRIRTSSARVRRRHKPGSRRLRKLHPSHHFNRR